MSFEVTAVFSFNQSVKTLWQACKGNFFIVYCKLQTTQLARVISKIEVRKGREAGTIHRWFTGVVQLD